MYCKHCGKEIADDSKSCNHCGGIIDAEIRDNEAPIQNKIDSNSSSTSISKFIGRICLYIILLVVLFGILAAIRKLSKDLLGNSVLYWCSITAIGSIVLYYIIVFLISKRKTISKDAKYFTTAVVFILIISVIGHFVSNNIAEQRMIRNSPKQEETVIKHINTILPIDIDEKLSWVKIEYETDSIYFEYLIDDSSLDFEITVLDAYQEAFIKNLIMVTNKDFVEQMVKENKKLKFRIISQWNYSKQLDMSLIGLELDYVLKKVNSD